MTTLGKIVANWAVPIVVPFSYLFLIYSMDASFPIAMFTLLGCAIIIVIWFMFRTLAAHAAISRAIAVGEPDDVVQRARNAIDHRLTQRGRLPFRVYEAIGLGLRGQWAESLVAVENVGAAAPPRWQLLAGAARIAAATELADPARARTSLEAITPIARRLGPSADITLRECQARVRFVEGDLAAAAPLFRALTDDIRLGPAPRAAALYYTARCTEDRDQARTLYERAMGLAPRTWIHAAARRQLDA